MQTPAGSSIPRITPPKKILLVEDDKSIREVMVMLLEAEGFQVRTADCPVDAIKEYDRERPDLILLDYILREGKASEIVDHVSKIDHTPIILVTAASHSDAIAQTLKIKHLLKKPFAIEDLVGMVKTCIDCP